MNLKECFEKGLLKKTAVDKEKVNNSVELAGHFLERAGGNFKEKYFDVAFLLAYTSMFHSSRVLLFRKGFKERSHYCLIALLKERFRENQKIFKYMDILDSYRISRHAIQYTGSACLEIDAREAIDDAKNFLGEVKKFLNKELK